MEIRAAELRVARSGLAGIEAAEAATAVCAEQTDQLNHANLAFMLQVITATAALNPAAIAELDPSRAQGAIRAAAFEAAGKAGLKANELEALFADVALSVAPLGIDLKRPGRLRQLHSDLIVFRTELTEWVKRNPYRDPELAKFCAEVIELTLEKADTVLQRVDAVLATPLELMRLWKRKRLPFLELVTRASWLLDGWELILAVWGRYQKR